MWKEGFFGGEDCLCGKRGFFLGGDCLCGKRDFGGGGQETCAPLGLYPASFVWAFHPLLFSSAFCLVLLQVPVMFSQNKVPDQSLRVLVAPHRTCKWWTVSSAIATPSNRDTIILLVQALSNGLPFLKENKKESRWGMRLKLDLLGVQRHYYRVGSHLKFQTGQNETFQSVPELSGTYRSSFDVKSISSMTS